ncbi:unnamed protein product [Peronospora belbahrii]|uniref:Peroxisome membrane anchor protein Pex14p N-terminal domain-containing protein n=1 Tax=Peronospora belbahrii TaxID=622444 RepID=A0AAU9LAK7_9STRA|nr:unnamed protein product [Peronospora belbahrii]
MMPGVVSRDPSLLLKCQDFLLHPTVRTLSLAQRVDFLEKKGLSPEEITQCLKSIEQRNGLSRLAQRTAKDLATHVDISRLRTLKLAVNSPLQLLQYVVKKYGIVMLLLMLLGYGYVQFRQSKMDQLLLQRQGEKTRRSKRLHARVEALLDVVKHQQMQYKQAAELLRARVTKVLVSEETTINMATMLKTNSSVTQLSRGLELQALQSELLDLKSAVVDTYLHPPGARKSLEKKEISMLLQPALLDKGVQVVQATTDTRHCVESFETGGALCTAVKKACQTVVEPHKKAYKKQSEARDQTSMSTEEITALFQRGQVEEELSTAGSYRLLFAT